MSDDRELALAEMLDRWLVRGAIAVVVTLQFVLINDFGYGSRWLAPVVELVLLVPLTVLTIRAKRSHGTRTRASSGNQRTCTAGSTTRLE